VALARRLSQQPPASQSSSRWSAFAPLNTRTVGAYKLSRTHVEGEDADDTHARTRTYRTRCCATPPPPPRGPREPRALPPPLWLPPWGQQGTSLRCVSTYSFDGERIPRRSLPWHRAGNHRRRVRPRAAAAAPPPRRRRCCATSAHGAASTRPARVRSAGPACGPPAPRGLPSRDSLRLSQAVLWSPAACCCGCQLSVLTAGNSLSGWTGSDQSAKSWTACFEVWMSPGRVSSKGTAWMGPDVARMLLDDTWTRLDALSDAFG